MGNLFAQGEGMAWIHTYVPAMWMEIKQQRKQTGTVNEQLAGWGHVLLFRSSSIARRVNLKAGPLECVHEVNSWPEGESSGLSQRSWQALPLKLTVSWRSCWNREDWFVVILKLHGLEAQLLLEPPSYSNLTVRRSIRTAEMCQKYNSALLCFILFYFYCVFSWSGHSGAMLPRS